MKTNKMYLSFILAMVLVVTPFLANLPNASADVPYKTVLIQTPFSTHTLSKGETMEWDVPFSNLRVMPKMDIMYVVDTTGSMSGIRSAVAATLNDFTADLMEAGAVDIYFGAAFFGDYTYDNPWFGIALSLGDHELLTVKNAIENLHITQGNDAPEDSLMAYMTVVAETEWREDSQHVVVLVTDAPTKFRSEITVGGYPVTIEGACLLSETNNIQAVFMTYGSRTMLGDLPSMIGTTEHLWTQATLQTRLKDAVIPPEESWVDYDCEVRVDSITYESDGAPSTDVIVSITSEANFVLSPEETEHFTFTATGNSKPARYDDASIVEIGYYIDNVKVDSASQYLIYSVEAPLLVSVTPEASVEQLSENKNNLIITITEQYADDTLKVFTQTFSINNNAAATYSIGSYNVYVDTKGNTQIRACYLV